MLNEKCMFVKIDFVSFYKEPHIWDKQNKSFWECRKKKVLRQLVYTIKQNILLTPKLWSIFTADGKKSFTAIYAHIYLKVKMSFYFTTIIFYPENTG